MNETRAVLLRILDYRGLSIAWLDLEHLNLTLGSNLASLTIQYPEDRYCLKVGEYADLVQNSDYALYDQMFRGVIAAVNDCRVDLVEFEEWRRREQAESWL